MKWIIYGDIANAKTHLLKELQILSFITFNFSAGYLNAQQMDNQKLHAIIYTLSDKIEGDNGKWQFIIDSTLLFCLTDELHNRMRIIAPVDKMENIKQDQVNQCMEANFHTALDVRYSISDGILWSAFIHPLRKLNKDQVISGISQVYSCVKTFGTTYSSGALSFPTNEERDIQKN